jgi:predicted transposase/invertase (TIGR01784 family)
MNTPLKRFFLSKELRLKARDYASRGKPLNLMLDYVFKAVFTGNDADSREALRKLLSDCTHRTVTKMRIRNNEILPERSEGKTVRFDIHVNFNDGEAADIEMQLQTSGDDIKARASLLAARLLSGQSRRGSKYRHIKRVYQIFFLNFILFPENADGSTPISGKIPRRYVTTEKEEHDQLNDLTEIIFYEFPKLDAFVRAYNEGKESLETLPEEAKWCIFIKYENDETAKKLITDICKENKGIMMAEQALNRVSFREWHWARALSREIGRMDYESGLSAAREDGFADGESAGSEKERQKAMEAAKQMKADGFTVEQIKRYSPLPGEEIDKIFT